MRLDLVIFDCDGVLVDSETTASTVVAQNLSSLGWRLTTQEAMRLFLGMSITDMEPIIESQLGHPVPAHWRAQLADAILDALAQNVRPIAGARAMLERMNAANIGWRVASNSSPEEMEVKFARCGLADLTDGRAYSASTVIAAGGRAKPAPDLFWSAAGATPPQNCLVIEDRAIGVSGATAAGMTCYGFSPHGTGAQLTAAGASRIIKSLEEIPGVFT
jgi:HAD superfamily hydrolase (TIGR01509 family)